MRIIPVKQGSQEWLDWRKAKITASDASVILRTNKYSNPRTLWEEKMDLISPKRPNKHMERGRTLEPVARNLFIQQTGVHVEPLVVEHDDLYWMGASLDGIDDSEDIIVEIKCPMIGGHLGSLIFGEILPMYRAQMQHALYVTGARICYYVTYNEQWEEKMSIQEVTPDEGFIQHLVEAETTFYKEFMCGSFKCPDTDWRYKKAAA